MKIDLRPLEFIANSNYSTFDHAYLVLIDKEKPLQNLNIVENSFTHTIQVAYLTGEIYANIINFVRNNANVDTIRIFSNLEDHFNNAICAYIDEKTNFNVKRISNLRSFYFNLPNFSQDFYNKLLIVEAQI